MFSELAECHEGKVVFVVTKEMIDEFIEMGFYSFQIRLYDSAEMKSRVTIPPVMNGFDIRNPIAAEDETNVVDQGIVDYARIFKDQSNEELPTFTWDGEYVKTEWVHHDVITENKLNKIEDALYSINANVKESDVVMLNTLDQVKKDADAYVKEHMAEVEADVEEFERNLNTGVEQFKIDTNAAMTAHKNEVSEVVDGLSGEVESINTRTTKSVKEFGAIGDGVTDDTAAFQRAVDEAQVLYIPEGDYVLSSPIVLPNRSIFIRGDKQKSIVRCSSTSVDVFTNVQNYSTFRDFRITCKSNAFIGSLSYCGFSGISIIGESNSTVCFTDTDPTWCGFIEFNSCDLRSIKCVFYSTNSKNYVKFNDCTIQRFYYIVAGPSEAVSFNGCDIEFSYGAVLGATNANLQTHYSPSFHSCYIEGTPILDSTIAVLDGSANNNLVARNCKIDSSWIYTGSNVYLVRTKNSESSFICEDCTIMTADTVTPIFYMGSDSSLYFKTNYASCRSFNSDGTQSSVAPSQLVEGPSRNISIIHAEYNKWVNSGTQRFKDSVEFDKTINSSKGIYLGDGIDSAKKGCIYYSSSSSRYCISASSQQVGRLIPLFSAATIADLKTITPYTEVAFGYTKDNLYLYVYIENKGWTQIAFE